VVVFNISDSIQIVCTYLGSQSRPIPAQSQRSGAAQRKITTERILANPWLLLVFGIGCNILIKTCECLGVLIRLVFWFMNVSWALSYLFNFILNIWLFIFYIYHAICPKKGSISKIPQLTIPLSHFWGRPLRAAVWETYIHTTYLSIYGALGWTLFAS